MSRVPSNLKASLDLNAIPPTGGTVGGGVNVPAPDPSEGAAPAIWSQPPVSSFGAGGVIRDSGMPIVGEPGPEMIVTPEAPNVENVEAATVRVDREIMCPCGQILVHVDHVSRAAILHVFERNILRPHTLTAGDVPLNWRCHACGQVTTIGA